MRNLPCVALLALLCLGAQNVRAEIVGNVGAVNQAAQGTPPGGRAKALAIGAGVVDRERIETKADGRAQIVFLDKSTLGVGANSSVTIDRFVYDAAAGAGKQSVSIAKGALRFIGGEVSHGAGMEIKTPSATIGVRGGMVLVRVGGAECGAIAQPRGGCDEIILLNGAAAIVTAKGRRQVLTRPGYGVFVGSDGEDLSDPAPAGQAAIEGFDRQFASLPGQTGGVSVAALPSGAQAIAQLGNFRMPDRNPWAGLGAIGAHWGAAGIAQSRAQTNNQTVATRTQQTLAAVAAALDAAAASDHRGALSGIPIDLSNPVGGALGALFAHGFCVWGCVTPTLVSQSVAGATLQATFPGYGHFLITLNVNPASVNYAAGQNSASVNGTIAATVVYYPAGGGAAQTNTYNFVVSENLSWSGMATANGVPTTFNVNGSDTLNHVNASGIVLDPPATSTNSFFSLPNGFTESFNFSYP